MDDSRDISSQNPHSLRKVKKRFVKSYTKSTKSLRFCFKITVYMALNLLFCLSKSLFGIFALSFLANRPLFATS